MTQGRANLLLLFAGAIWGLGFVAQASAVGNVGAFLFIGLRFGLASLTVAPLAIHEARQAKQRLALKDYGGFIFIGLFLSVGSVLQQIGLATTTVTNSGFLTGLYVVMVPIFGVMLFWNWPSPIVWPCALTALGGIYLLSGGQLGNLTTGDWLTILCAAFWALQINLDLHLGLIGRVVGHIVKTVLVPIDLVDEAELVALLDPGDDLGEFQRFFRRDRRRLGLRPSRAGEEKRRAENSRDRGSHRRLLYDCALGKTNHPCLRFRRRDARVGSGPGISLSFFRSLAGEARQIGGQIQAINCVVSVRSTPCSGGQAGWLSCS